ncbi:MAG TPA: ribosome maturation factor RimP [Mycobacteriales bacterium]|nr:ribosome maturation factor RimP [Mycobacteriales bacterium]
MGSASRQRDHLTTLIEPVVSTFGYDLEDLSVNPAGRRSLVRVIVDGDDGIALDDVAEVSKAISATLDEHEGVMGRSPYVLEVTSPGVDRPLTQPRHWRRSIGRLVKLHTADGHEKSGRVVDAGETAVELDFDGEVRSLDYAKIRSAKVQIEFNRKGPSQGDEDPEDQNEHKNGHSEGGRP